MHLGRGEDVRSRAGGGGEAEEAAAVAGTASFAAVAVDGGLELAGGAQALSLTLVRVEVLHVPVGGGGEKAPFNSEFRLVSHSGKKALAGDGFIVYLLVSNVKTSPSCGSTGKKTTDYNDDKMSKHISS